MKTILATAILLIALAGNTPAQTETLTNADIIAMSRAGLGAPVLVQKIKTTGGSFDVSAKALIELKNASVADEVIALMLEKAKGQPEKTAMTNPLTPDGETLVRKKSLTPAESLASARTLAILKDSINPSRQALEKELLKRADWKQLNLSITRDRDEADLTVEIGFVHFSILTHRYVFRVYDRRSGLIVAAGETTSWGSLAENLAREISKKLAAVK